MDFEINIQIDLNNKTVYKGKLKKASGSEFTPYNTILPIVSNLNFEIVNNMSEDTQVTKKEFNQNDSFLTKNAPDTAKNIPINMAKEVSPTKRDSVLANIRQKRENKQKLQRS